ncbi:MAG: hypothetical protein ACE5I9_05455 [Candidatus Methylomirabilales bacterium]
MQPPAEGHGLTETAETFQAELWEGRRRAERLEGVLRQVLHRVPSLGEVYLFVLDAGKGECLVALRHLHNLVQVRLWRELVDEILGDPDPGIQQVLERILLGALEP